MREVELLGVAEVAGGRFAPLLTHGRSAPLLPQTSFKRRMSRNYEFLPEPAEALIYVTMIRLVLKRLVKGVTAGIKMIDPRHGTRSA